MKKTYKKVMLGAAVIAAFLTFAFAFATCQQDSGGTLLPDITYTAKANGNTSERTTEIVFEFSAYVASLSKEDITIDGSPGSATKGDITGSGRNWRLGIAKVTTGGAATVSIAKTGIDSGLVGINLSDGTGGGGASTFSTAPNISVTLGNAALTVNLTNTPSPTPANYDVYYMQGSHSAVDVISGGTKAGEGAALPHTISAGLSNGTAYSVAAVAKKAGYTDGVSNVATGTPAAPASPSTYVTFSLFATDATTPAQGTVTPKFTALGTMEYSTDAINWNSVTKGTAYTSSTDGLIYFRGTFAENRLFTSSFASNAWSTSASKMKINGNLNTLLNYASPPTAVGQHCYDQMFSGCTSLVDVSGLTLPATTPASYCYYEMFAGCTFLVNDPALPATTTSSSCYRGMFENCTSLVNAPVLPASGMSSASYYRMFYGCTSLGVVAIATTSLDYDHYFTDMLTGVTAGGTLYSDGTQPSTPAGWTKRRWAEKPY